jgi:hypothetical protein
MQLVECLVFHGRLLSRGETPPPSRELSRGDVSTRSGSRGNKPIFDTPIALVRIYVYPAFMNGAVAHRPVIHIAMVP